MREILFRGKRVDNGRWVYGFPFSVYANLKIDGIERWDGERHLIIEDTIGQYIGMYDKYDFRIFEGDICKFREWDRGDMCWIGKVHYEHQQFVISGGPNEERATSFTLCMSRFIPENIEVIGNINDTPELLEVE